MYLEQKVELLEKMIDEMQQKITYLEVKGTEQILTPEEFSKLFKINQNTVYCWIREGRIKILPNLGTAKRIPMSQFYETSDNGNSPKTKKKKSDQKMDDLKAEFMRMRQMA